MKETIYITSHWNKYDKKFNYSVQGYKPSNDSGYILLEERDIEFDSPSDIDLRLRIANALKEKKTKVLADAHVEAKEIDEEIQELLALEDKSKEDDGIPF